MGMFFQAAMRQLQEVVLTGASLVVMSTTALQSLQDDLAILARARESGAGEPGVTQTDPTPPQRAEDVYNGKFGELLGGGSQSAGGPIRLASPGQNAKPLAPGPAGVEAALGDRVPGALETALTTPTPAEQASQLLSDGTAYLRDRERFKAANEEAAHGPRSIAAAPPDPTREDRPQQPRESAPQEGPDHGPEASQAPQDPGEAPQQDQSRQPWETAPQEGPGHGPEASQAPQDPGETAQEEGYER